MHLLSKLPVQSAVADGSDERTNMDRIDVVNTDGIDHWNVPLWQLN